MVPPSLVRKIPAITLLLLYPATISAATPAEIQAWITAHNTYRSLHGAAPVTWSKTIATSAQTFADTCPSAHSGSEYGENLAWATNNRSIGAIVKMWYNEEPKYDYNNPGFTPGTGHFTQLIWKRSTEIGCGLATSCDTGWSNIWVCQYNPPGNYIGQFADNIFPQLLQ